MPHTSIGHPAETERGKVVPVPHEFDPNIFETIIEKS
jgi:hypothetical protein